MARTHGWAGDPPADDDEARRRILDAARRCIDSLGPDLGLSDVARDLGVSRPTVYRYFPGTDVLLRAAGARGLGEFTADLERHLSADFGGPAEVVVEAIAYGLERTASDPYFALVLAHERIGAFGRGFTTSEAREVAHSVMDRLPVDWAGYGVEGEVLDELFEHMLRMVQTFALDPRDAARDGVALRTYLRRWVAPAVDQLTSGAGVAGSA